MVPAQKPRVRPFCEVFFFFLVGEADEEKQCLSLILPLSPSLPRLSFLSLSLSLERETKEGSKIVPVVWSECACVRKYVANSGPWNLKPSTSTFVFGIRFATRAWSAIAEGGG